MKLEPVQTYTELWSVFQDASSVLRTYSQSVIPSQQEAEGLDADLYLLVEFVRTKFSLA